MNQSSGMKPGLLGPNDRKSLSVESFGTVSNDAPVYLGGIHSLVRILLLSHESTNETDIDGQTLVCRRLRDIGLDQLFVRQSVRFSLEEFLRLEEIASHDRIPAFVQKLSYMIHPFYYQSMSAR